jgi:hypothetical protein
VKLDSHKVTHTIESLRQRIHDRFPRSGLHTLCGHLHELARETEDTIGKISKPIWSLRIGAAFLICAFITTLITILINQEVGKKVTLYDLIQTLDAGGNLLILVGLSVVFLWSLETKHRRRRVTQAINRLRDIAHIVDMKQLTKDPAGVAEVSQPTEHSPKRELDAFALGRYLDYCSEMLSLVSKLGYLYVATFHDPELTRTVNDLENLCTGLSRKIWQKIMILRSESDGKGA